MLGGVATLPHMGVAWEGLGVATFGAEEVQFPLYSCPITLYLNDHSVQSIKLTGVYIPPKAAGTEAQITHLADPTKIRTIKNKRAGHLLTGDSNLVSWEPLDKKWVGLHGLKLLLDTDRSTRHSGNSRDSIIPGILAPEQEDPPNTDDAEHTDWKYPSVTSENFHVGNHHPVTVMIPTMREIAHV